MLASVRDIAGVDLQRDLDGRIRGPEGALPDPDQGAVIRQGVLEMSNVNAVEELLVGIEQQRGFEIGMRMILAARELDEAGARILQAPPA